MDVILQEIGLGTLIDRFKEERIDLEVLVSLNDTELNRLGVNTIGERARLRESCRKKLASQSISANQSHRSVLARERSLLFAPSTSSSRRTTSTERNKKTTKKRPWTVQFLCLADKYSSKVPSASEKQILYKAGLGVKKIKLDLDDDEETVKNKVTSDTKDDRTQTVMGFPQLRSAGGFEMMLCMPNCRDLSVINSSWSANDLKASLGGGQAKIYLRPIQQSLSTTPLGTHTNVSSIKETCNLCQQEFLVKDLRSHIWLCSTRVINDSPDEDAGTSTSGESSVNPVRNADEDPGTSTSGESSVNPVRNADEDPGTSTSGESSVSPVRNDPVSRTDLHLRTREQQSFSGAEDHFQREEIIIDDNDEIISVTSHGTETRQDVACNDGGTFGSKNSLGDAVDSTLKYCDQHEVVNPVEILRSLQFNVVYGRALDVQDPSSICEGETNFILVDRDNLLETAFDKINNITDLRRTLEVQFYNEVAADYGGPRKEFFRLILRQIKETYFDKGLREMLSDKYLTVGIVLGLSILQNGKMPNYISEEIIQSIFSKDDPSSPCVIQLREGLKKLGIYQIGCRLPVFLNLLRPGPAQPLTFRKVVWLLQPIFSEAGSNARKFENEVYAQLTKYLREASSGRRNGVMLNDVLQFVTGADDEPVLGFAMRPTINFVEVDASFIPTSNTCTNSMNLPRASHSVPLPTAENLFNLYDYAFANAYFGNR